jgi:hypothetical protein
MRGSVEVNQQSHRSLPYLLRLRTSATKSGQAMPLRMIVTSLLAALGDPTLAIKCC